MFLFIFVIVDQESETVTFINTIIENTAYNQNFTRIESNFMFCNIQYKPHKNSLDFTEIK